MAEASATGAAAAALFQQGFLWVMLGVLAGMLLALLAVLLLRGPERVHFVLDGRGVHARVYVPEGCGALRLCALHHTGGAVEMACRGRPSAAGRAHAGSARDTALGRASAGCACGVRGQRCCFSIPVLAGAGYALPAGRFARWRRNMYAKLKRSRRRRSAPNCHGSSGNARSRVIKGEMPHADYAGMSRMTFRRSRRCFTIRCTR